MYMVIADLFVWLVELLWSATKRSTEQEKKSVVGFGSQSLANLRLQESKAQ